MKRIGTCLTLMMLCGAAQAKVNVAGNQLDISTDCLEVATKGITIGTGDCEAKKPKSDKPENRSFKGNNNPGKGHKPKH
ncbi:CG2 omega domain protein [Vibrio fluvialis]|nr:CG2 omega domain protein [Vibrio fluvialis]MBY7797782.1 CG2 omega domain protein [Vibrio fluvialis]MBY7859719.1 CG2 omega domain protein [Vibrio fluvialis]